MIRFGKWEEQITAIYMEVMVGRRTAVACTSLEAAELVIETVRGRTGEEGQLVATPFQPFLVKFAPPPPDED